MKLFPNLGVLIAFNRNLLPLSSTYQVTKRCSSLLFSDLGIYICSRRYKVLGILGVKNGNHIELNFMWILVILCWSYDVMILTGLGLVGFVAFIINIKYSFLWIFLSKGNQRGTTSFMDHCDWRVESWWISKLLSQVGFRIFFFFVVILLMTLPLPSSICLFCCL